MALKTQISIFLVYTCLYLSTCYYTKVYMSRDYLLIRAHKVTRVPIVDLMKFNNDQLDDLAHNSNLGYI